MPLADIISKRIKKVLELREPGPDATGAFRLAILDDDTLTALDQDDDFKRYAFNGSFQIYNKELWAWEGDEDAINWFNKNYGG